jgi:hypothetical protein
LSGRRFWLPIQCQPYVDNLARPRRLAWPPMRSRIGKIPAKIILVIFSATKTKTCLYAALGMKRVHRIEPLAEAAPRHSHLDEVREFPFTSATLVASHRFTGCTGGLRCSNSLASANWAVQTSTRRDPEMPPPAPVPPIQRISQANSNPRARASGGKFARQ